MKDLLSLSVELERDSSLPLNLVLVEASSSPSESIHSSGFTPGGQVEVFSSSHTPPLGNCGGALGFKGEQISFLFDCIVRGVTPSRAPHGLRPSLPADLRHSALGPTAPAYTPPSDLSADPGSAEERISQQTSDLEKRLSMLSQCSLASSSSSTASTYSCSTSVAGDDHSSISSSSSSQSDTSYGSRLSFWVEPLARLHLSTETVSSSSTVKALASADDRLYAAVMGGTGTRPSSAQLHPRGLHDSGRQSSLDSGIGTGTGSQSSYSGSCSSCTGSLDAASQGGGEEIDSVASQPATSSPPSAPPPSPQPPSSPFQSTLIPDHSAANCPCSSCSFPSRSSSRASSRHSEDYQIPGLLRQRYDTPRSLLHNPAPEGNPSPGSPT
ncbi:unnamed protein product [Pleuronectes platessa]|uniref:IRS-type PTB domain-containing protein n=1 Tax=Pleuronectes platessa TaxID=8262 RepID=A0A9N7TP11_PLEPL|nr:unnamed protein product [Pleuronectes platessa]